MSTKIAAALHQVMSAVGYVQKTGRNDFHKYNYAGEADLLEKLRPAMLEAGLILIPSVQDVSPVDEYGNTHVRVAYTLLHKDGDVWPHQIIAAGCGNDKSKNGGVGDKGVYKAITGANKYLLFKLFQIETGDEPEATRDDPPPPAPKATYINGGNKARTALIAQGELIASTGNLANLAHWWTAVLSAAERHTVGGDDFKDALKRKCEAVSNEQKEPVS